MHDSDLQWAGTRRTFLKTAAAGAGLAAMAIPKMVHAAGADETLRVGLVGCGGRGSAAAIDALHADQHAKLVAIGDTFEDRAQLALKQIKRDEKVGDRCAVPPDNIFSGFDAYKQVVDSGVDVVILATPPHFRPLHLAYAVDKKKHVFVEKPVAVDMAGADSIDVTCKKAEAMRLSIVSGLCWRYHPGVRETMERISNGAIGDIVAIESKYNGGTLWHRGDKPDWSRMEYQVRNWLYFTWLSGDHICEQAVHSLDKCAWLLGDASPAQATATGGRQQRTSSQYGNIWDHFTVFYEFDAGPTVFFTCRQQNGCSTYVDDIVYGTKGKAQILANRIEGKQNWRYAGPEPSMYRVEHEALFRSIRDASPINNGTYMVNSTRIAIMGRMAAYSGKTLKWNDAVADTTRLGPTDYAWSDLPEEPVAVPGTGKFA